MLIKTSSIGEEEFDKVFYEIPHNVKLDLANENQVKFFILNIQNNQYSYYELFKILKKNLGRYALSRKEFRADLEMAISKAISRFHEVKNAGTGAGGELGELLLYLFLEVVLGAPKLLSKMELKGTPNQYNYNSDAVHYFQYETDYGKHNQVVLCESKLIGDCTLAISKAFDSLSSSLVKREYDFSLVATEIFKETMSETEAQEVINSIVPNTTEDIKNNVIKETAAGIFIGFDEKIEPTGDSLKTRANTINNITLKIPKIVKKLDEKIEEKKLKGMSFYIYFLPFNDVDKDREKIMEQLLTKDHFEG
ncbi:MAG: DUF1837 domain-containing protein [Clostridia bacterium]|nr:DUF1837 domain-containing protein [Clostridia bacterium]